MHSMLFLDKKSLWVAHSKIGLIIRIYNISKRVRWWEFSSVCNMFVCPLCFMLLRTYLLYLCIFSFKLGTILHCVSDFDNALVPVFSAFYDVEYTKFSRVWCLRIVTGIFCWALVIADGLMNYVRWLPWRNKMTGRGRGRGRGRGTPLFINKDMKDLLSSQAVGRADEIPPPLYDVSATKFVFNFSWQISVLCLYKSSCYLYGFVLDIVLSSCLAQ